VHITYVVRVGAIKRYGAVELRPYCLEAEGDFVPSVGDKIRLKGAGSVAYNGTCLHAAVFERQFRPDFPDRITLFLEDTPMHPVILASFLKSGWRREHQEYRRRGLVPRSADMAYLLKYGLT
jgi:hypothetical protein